MHSLLANLVASDRNDMADEPPPPADMEWASEEEAIGIEDDPELQAALLASMMEVRIA